MPSISVHILRSGRRVGLAEARPVRITPDGTGGVVYHGKVYPVGRYGDGTYAVEIVGTSYSADQSICRLASHAEARRLLGLSVTGAPGGQAPKRAVAGAERTSDKARAVKSPERSPTPALVEILGLLSMSVPAPATPTDRDHKSVTSPRSGSADH